MYRAGNPALSDSTFDKNAYKDTNWWETESSNQMTIEGVSEKTAILLIVTATSAIATAMMMPEATLLMIIGFIGAIICSIICLLYTSPSPRDRQKSRMPSSA